MTVFPESLHMMKWMMKKIKHRFVRYGTMNLLAGEARHRCERRPLDVRSTTVSIILPEPLGYGLYRSVVFPVPNVAPRVGVTCQSPLASVSSHPGVRHIERVAVEYVESIPQVKSIVCEDYFQWPDSTSFSTF
jgi:hypothetical protein